MKLQKSFSFILISLIVLFNGCYDPEILDIGTCKVNVSGYINKSFSGQAVFENVPTLTNTNGKVFFMHLKDVSLPNDKYCYVEFSGSQPELGTYNLTNIENADSYKGILIGSYRDWENGETTSVGGKIGITYASETELKGWFDFPGHKYIPLGNGTYQIVEIRVSGEFYAIKGSVGVILN